MRGDFIQAEFRVTHSERCFERWLGHVEALTGASFDTEFVVLLLSDEALEAFEEGVSAVEYALRIQAAGAS